MYALLADPLETAVFETELLAAQTERAARPMPLVEEPSISEKQEGLHGGVFKTLALVNIATLGTFWLTFLGDAEALFMVAISSVYLAAYLGTPLVMNKVGEIDASQTKPFHEFLAEPFETWTGIITGREAMLQVLMVPVAILVTAVGMGVIIANAG